MSVTVFEGPPLSHVPPTNLTLPQFMLDSTHPLRPIRSTGNPWLIDDTTGVSYNFEVTRSRVFGLANSLAARWGIKDNDVVCTFTPNDVDYPIAMWAIHRLGAAVTPANPSYTCDELVYQIQTANASLLITHAASLSTAEAAATKAGIPKDRIIVLDSREDTGVNRRHSYPTIDGLIREGLQSPPAFVERRLGDEEGTKKIAYLCFSSGTTGKPKAVAIPHCSVISNVIQFASFNRVVDPTVPYEKQRFRPGDVTLGVLPMYHIYSIVVVLHVTLFCGHTIVVFPKFNLKGTVQSIIKYSITHLWVVPPMVVLFCKDKGLKQRDLATIRYVMVGAAPLSPEVIKQLIKLLPRNAVVGQGYGMTETSTIVCMQPWDVQQVIDGGAGRLISGTKIRVIGSDGKPVSYDQPGELHVLGPQTMYNSYLNNPAANDETWYDGWVRTGDEVVIKKNGDIFIVDRLKEILKVKGFQVAPAELEGHLLDHPAVADAGVVGIPDEFCGQVPVAFIQLQPDFSRKIKGDQAASRNLEKDIAKYVADSKVEYKHLRGGVYFVDAIPKNPSGKILRRSLRDLAKGLNLSGPGQKAKM